MGLNVAIISHGYPPVMGGASNRAWNIASALAKRGHRVIALAAFPTYPSGSAHPRYRCKLVIRERLGGAEVFRTWVPRVPVKGLFGRLVYCAAFTLSYSLALLWLAARRLDAIFYISPYSLSPFSLPALVFGRLRRVLTVLDVADLWPEIMTETGGIRSGIAERIFVAMARLAALLGDRVTAITEGIKERLIQLGLPKEKLVTLGLGVDTDLFRPKGAKALPDERLRGKFVVEYSGIFDAKYDFWALVEAAKLVGRMASDVLFLIRGDGELRDSVSKLSEGLGNVLVLGKVDSLEEVVDWLNAADVLVCPLRDLREGSAIVPSKVLEYMAVGKPIVCSAKGETERVIREHGAGLVLPPGDPRSLSEAIMRLYRDDNLRRRMSHMARRAAEERYSLERIAGVIERLQAVWSSYRAPRRS